MDIKYTTGVGGYDITLGSGSVLLPGTLISSGVFNVLFLWRFRRIVPLAFSTDCLALGLCTCVSHSDDVVALSFLSAIVE